MDSSNHWYGHAHILAEYCGLDKNAPPRINGIIQHGWTFVHGFGYGHQPPWGFTKYVWGEVNARRGQAIGWRDYLTIGAPFRYLSRLRPVDEQAERRGTIWYPFHGTADYESVTGAHDALIRQIREVEGDEPVTVCLYYVEYDQPEIRAEYENAGFRVICHGQRGAKWQGTTPDFLDRQLAELRRHRRVVSNRLSTAIFYGLSEGLEAGVYGDPMTFVGGRAGFIGDGLLERNYAAMFGPRTDTATCRAIADDELGEAWLMEPNELRHALGWGDL